MRSAISDRLEEAITLDFTLLFSSCFVKATACHGGRTARVHSVSWFFGIQLAELEHKESQEFAGSNSPVIGWGKENNCRRRVCRRPLMDQRKTKSGPVMARFFTARYDVCCVLAP